MTAKQADKKDSKDGKEQSFEAAMERLEKIVEEMEGGRLGLEEMISRFEEGQGLIRLCTGKLNEVEKKVELLVKKGETIAVEPFDGDEPDEDAEENGDGELF